MASDPVPPDAPEPGHDATTGPTGEATTGSTDEDGITPSESAYELFQRGTALMAGRHHAQAAVVLERAARLEPGKGSILEALGRARFISGQAALAAEAFDALLEVDPSSHYGHYALGRALKRLGRTAEARTHVRLAVAMAPGSALYRGALARLPVTDPPAGD